MGRKGRKEGRAKCQDITKQIFEEALPSGAAESVSAGCTTTSEEVCLAKGKETGERAVAEHFEPKPSSKTTPLPTIIENKGRNRDRSVGIPLSKVVVGDEVIIPEEGISPVETVWGFCLVGCFTGRFPGIKAIEGLMSSWSVKCRLIPHDKGWVIFQFDHEEDRKKVFDKGPYTLYGKSLVLRILPEKFRFDFDAFMKVDVWVKFYDVPVQLWNRVAFECLGSRVGTPLHTDEVTKAKGRSSFCRMLITVDMSKELPTSFTVCLHGGDSYVQKVDYEGLPNYCFHCKKFGHNPFHCRVLQAVRLKKSGGHEGREPATLSKGKATLAMKEGKTAETGPEGDTTSRGKPSRRARRRARRRRHAGGGGEAKPNPAPLSAAGQSTKNQTDGDGVEDEVIATAVNVHLEEEADVEDEVSASSEYEDEAVSSASQPAEDDGVGDQAGSSEEERRPSSEEETDNTASESGSDQEDAYNVESPTVDCEGLPNYCFDCKKFGHNPFDCRVFQAVHLKKSGGREGREPATLSKGKATVAMKEGKTAETGPEGDTTSRGKPSRRARRRARRRRHAGGGGEAKPNPAPLSTPGQSTKNQTDGDGAGDVVIATTVNVHLEEEAGVEDEASASSDYEDEAVSSASQPDEDDGVGDQAGSSEEERRPSSAEESDNTVSESGSDQEDAYDVEVEPPPVKDISPAKKKGATPSSDVWADSVLNPWSGLTYAQYYAEAMKRASRQAKLARRDMMRGYG